MTTQEFKALKPEYEAHWGDEFGLYSQPQHYYAGVDYGGYDNNSYALCIMNEEREVVFIFQCRDKDEFLQEVRKCREAHGPNISFLIEDTRQKKDFMKQIDKPE